MPRSAIIALLVTPLLLPVLSGTAEAQLGVIFGVVRDVDGAPIADAQVVGENTQWQRRVETVTNNDGRFSYVGLRTGQWLFIVRRVGFIPVQGFANVSGSGRGARVTFAMEADPLHPPPPKVGVLANLRADELGAALDAADALFDGGNYDEAIEAYEAVLDNAPQLTSVNLQIGHAYREKADLARALAAYRAVPSDDLASREAQDAIEALQAGAGNR